MNKRKIEQIAKDAAGRKPGPDRDPIYTLTTEQKPSDRELLALFYAARISTVNTLTRMDGAEAQMRSALHEARTALKVFREGERNV